jgi:hypothetical protein
MSTENKGKTPQEWAEYLPEPIRTQFLKNVNPKYFSFREYTKTIQDCITYSFEWEMTEQGDDYWFDINTRAANGEFSKPIPTTPTEVKEETFNEVVLSEKSIDEAAAKYGNISLPIPYGYTGPANDFKNGAKWQLEQMKSKPQPTPTKEGNVTAVDILSSFLKSHCNPSVCDIEWSDLETAIREAKAMFEEQIEKAFENGVTEGDMRQGMDIDSFTSAYTYYNETFGGEK